MGAGVTLFAVAVGLCMAALLANSLSGESNTIKQQGQQKAVGPVPPVKRTGNAAVDPGTFDQTDLDTFVIEYKSVKLDSSALVSKEGVLKRIDIGAEPPQYFQLKGTTDTKLHLMPRTRADVAAGNTSPYPYTLQKNVTLQKGNLITSLKGSTKHQDIIQVNIDSTEPYYINTINMVCNPHEGEATYERRYQISDPELFKLAQICKPVPEQYDNTTFQNVSMNNKDEKIHIEGGIVTAKNEENQVITIEYLYSKKGTTGNMRGGGKAQLRAVRDAIRQYEAQSGERQLAARRSFNQAKRRLMASA